MSSNLPSVEFWSWTRSTGNPPNSFELFSTLSNESFHWHYCKSGTLVYLAIPFLIPLWTEQTLISNFIFYAKCRESGRSRKGALHACPLMQSILKYFIIPCVYVYIALYCSIALLQNDPNCSLFDDEHNLFVLKPPDTRNARQVMIVPAVLERDCRGDCSTKYVEYDPLNTPPQLPIVDADAPFILMNVDPFEETNYTANVAVITRARL